MISDRVKRNISAICIVIGTVCVISRVWEVIISPFVLTATSITDAALKKRATDFYRVSGSSISHIFTIRYSY